MKKEYKIPNLSVLRFAVDEDLTTTVPTLSSEGFGADDEVVEW